MSRVGVVLLGLGACLGRAVTDSADLEWREVTLIVEE